MPWGPNLKYRIMRIGRCVIGGREVQPASCMESIGLQAYKEPDVTVPRLDTTHLQDTLRRLRDLANPPP
jgi:hypothetical protein